MKYLVFLFLVVVVFTSCSEIIPEYIVTLRNNTYYAIAILTIGNEQLETRPRSKDERRLEEGNYNYKIMVGDVLETGVIGIYQNRTIFVYWDVIDAKYRYEWR